MNKIEIIPNYVDESFEQELLSIVPKKMQGGRMRNQVIRYGSSIPYPDRIVSSQIPEMFERFRDDIEFDSVTINEYMPGQEIWWHIDGLDGGPIIYVISLLSDADLLFKKDSEVLTFHVPRFSLTKFSDELRYEWKHYLKAENKRYSIVFRDSKKCVID